MFYDNLFAYSWLNLFNVLCCLLKKPEDTKLVNKSSAYYV